MPALGDQEYVILLLGVTVGVTEIEVVKQVNIPLFPEDDNETDGVVLSKVTFTTFPEALVAQPLVVLVTTTL